MMLKLQDLVLMMSRCLSKRWENCDWLRRQTCLSSILCISGTQQNRQSKHLAAEDEKTWANESTGLRLKAAVRGKLLIYSWQTCHCSDTWVLIVPIIVRPRKEIKMMWWAIMSITVGTVRTLTLKEKRGRKMIYIKSLEENYGWTFALSESIRISKEG